MTEAIPTGRRAIKVKARNDAIAAAAMDLARAESWPSPEAIAERSGISLSVVKRETALLLPARRLWVKVKGHDHPQWVDPETATTCAVAGGTVLSGDETVTDGEPVSEARGRPAKPEEGAEELGETARKLRRRNKELRHEAAVALELARRVNLGVRPAEIDLILKTGSANGAAGKPDKGVRIGA